MHCSDVIRRLSQSENGFDLDPAVSDHLASCDTCAEWAEDDARLLRTWHASRPAEPSIQAWNTVWTNLSAGLDASRRPHILTLPERPAASRRFRLGLVTLGFAQAAAILLAAIFLPGRHPSPQSVPSSELVAHATATPIDLGKVEFDSGDFAVIREKAGKWFKAPNPSVGDVLASNQLDDRYEMYNVVEAMADAD
jgi:hypothetical protein